MTKHYDIDANDIIRTVKMAKEKPKEKKPRKWYRPEFIVFKTQVVHGSERIRSWFAGLKWRF